MNLYYFILFCIIVDATVSTSVFFKILFCGDTYCGFMVWICKQYKHCVIKLIIARRFEYFEIRMFWKRRFKGQHFTFDPALFQNILLKHVTMNNAHVQYGSDVPRMDEFPVLIHLIVLITCTSTDSNRLSISLKLVIIDLVIEVHWTYSYSIHIQVHVYVKLWIYNKLSFNSTWFHFKDGFSFFCAID